DRDRAHAVLHRLAAGLFGGELRREGRRLARALEAARPGARPRHGVAVHVGDRDDGVVERRLNAGDARRDVLPDLLLARLGLATSSGSDARLRTSHDSAFRFLEGHAWRSGLAGAAA